MKGGGVTKLRQGIKANGRGGGERVKSRLINPKYD